MRFRAALTVLALTTLATIAATSSAAAPVLTLRYAKPTNPPTIASPWLNGQDGANPNLTTTTVPPPTTVPPAPVAAPDPSATLATLPADAQATFACIRYRESRDDPMAQNPSSTASGLYQFLDSSWLAYGGGQFAPRAFMASPAQQDQVAVWAWQQSGFGPWGGGC